jgi:predicted small lipoprotein YifL
MKKIILTLMGVMTIMSLVGCGTVTTDKGYSPETVTESKTVEESVNDNGKIEFSTDMTVEEMKEYYDTAKFVGTPRLVILQAELVTDTRDVITLSTLSSSHDGICVHIPNDHTLQSWGKYYCIVTDNNTPSDTTDDELAYIFTTPIE